MNRERRAAAKVVALLKRHGHTAVFAGGCVRDELIGRVPNDYDVATSALPGEVESLFERTLPVGKAFGIVVVLLDGEQIEVATLRADGQYGDGRRPDSVSYVTSLEEDAARREFTFNAMFLDPTTGEVFDFFNGREDLERGIIRAVGDPHRRIDEDRLRMLRAVRFASRFGFTIDPELAAAIGKHAPELLEGAKSLSFERIAKELRGILTSDRPLVGLDFLMESGLLEQIIPELIPCNGPLGDQDPEYHPEGNTWVHTRNVVSNVTGSSFELVLAALLHDVAKPRTQVRKANGRISNHKHDVVGAEMADEICRRLKLSNDTRNRVTEMVRLHMRMHVVQEMRPGKLAALLERKDIHDLIALQHADATGTGASCCSAKSNREFLLAKLVELSQVDNESQRLGAAPLVTGHTLIELGFTPGPDFRTMLEECMTAQHEGAFATADQAVAWVTEQFLK